MLFTFNVVYFKNSGKMGYSDYFDLDVKNCCGEGGPPVAYMYDAVDYLRNARTEGKLPGLRSGKWDGFITVDCEQGFPCLILPEGLKL